MIVLKKLELKVVKIQDIEVPEKAFIKTANLVKDRLYIWLEIDNVTTKKSLKRLALFENEEEIEKDANYICSFFGNAKSKDFHLYELTIRLSAAQSLLLNKIKGLVYGNAIGNAIGRGTALMTKNEIKIHYPETYSTYNQIIDDQVRSQWKKGEWTNDTDQMLCVLESLIEKEEIEIEDISLKLQNWVLNGGRDVETNVYHLVSSQHYLSNPHRAAQKQWENSGCKNAGNGAIARGSIVGAWCFQEYEKVIVNAANVAKTSHYDPRCVGSCVLVSYAISQLLQNEKDCNKICNNAIQMSQKYDDTIEIYLRLAKQSGIEALNLDEKSAIGYTLKTLGAGFWALQQTDFKTAILSITKQGGNADTNAAVAGAILGAKLGYDALPIHWIEGLLNKDKLNNLINQLWSLLMKTKQV